MQQVYTRIYQYMNYATHKLGLKAIKYWSDKNPELTISRFNKSFIKNASLKKVTISFLPKIFFKKLSELLWVLLLLLHVTY